MLSTHLQEAVSPAIRAKAMPHCPLCQTIGAVRYEGLRDRYFSVPGEWCHRHCAACDVQWLDPQPIAEDVPQLYARYYTHGTAAPTVRQTAKQRLKALVRTALLTRLGVRSDSYLARLLAPLVARVPGWLHIVERDLYYLRAGAGRVLDVGCGDGAFFERLHVLGYEPFGIEPDATAAAIARQRLSHWSGTRVETGTIHDTQFTPESFRVITLCHSIEHVPDPVDVLRKCYDLLQPGGTIVVMTPNCRSLGHQYQGESWRELDPPRHFILFSPDSLTRCLTDAGFTVEQRRGSTQNAAAIWADSEAIRLTGRMRENRQQSLPAQAKAFAKTVTADTADETTLIARKV